jgi:hypothetical protein
MAVMTTIIADEAPALTVILPSHLGLFRQMLLIINTTIRIETFKIAASYYGEEAAGETGKPYRGRMA